MLAFLALLGAPYIYDISSLRVNAFNAILYFVIGGPKLLIHILNRIHNCPRNMSSYPGLTYLRHVISTHGRTLLGAYSKNIPSCELSVLLLLLPKFHLCLRIAIAYSSEILVPIYHMAGYQYRKELGLKSLFFGLYFSH